MSRRKVVRFTQTLGTLTLAALAMVGCGQAQPPGAGASGATATTTTTTGTTADGSPSAEVNWDNPTGGDQVASYQEAKKEVGADIVDPQGLGDPKWIIVSPPSDIRVATFVYDNPTYGRIDVEEGPSQFDASSWSDYLKASVEAMTQPYASGSAVTVPVRGDSIGLLTTTADGSYSVLDWLDTSTGIETAIRGPSLTKDQAISIADNL